MVKRMWMEKGKEREKQTGAKGSVYNRTGMNTARTMGYSQVPEWPRH